MRGRKPTPTSLKLLRGNPGKRKINPNEPTVAALSASPPAWLDAEAIAKWNEIVPVLRDSGLLTALDADVLSVYCETWAEWKKATIGVQSHGHVVKAPSGYPIQNPWVTIRNKAAIQLRTLEAELGMTPSARSRLSVKPTEVAADDRWADIFG